MDVLSGSIDVRELLPGDALDESSPLSVPDLRLLIDRLQIRSLSIKDKVRSYVLAHRDDFYDLFSRCSSASSSVEGLSNSLSDALGLLSDRPLDLEIEALVSEIRDKRRELVERREALEVVRTLSAIHSQLTLAREDLKGGRLVAAAEAIRNLRKGMIFGSEKDEGGGVDEPAVYGFLRKDWSECFDELQDVLAKNALSCVQYEPESSKLIVRSLSQIGDTQNVELRMVLEAMGIVKVLEYGLGKVADLVMKHVIVPSITNNALTILVEEHDNGSLEGRQAILYIDSSSELKEDKDGSFLYSRLRQIVNFVYRFICFQNADWMQCFGKLTWPRMSDLIIIHFLSKAVPDAASKVIGFQNIVKCSAEFETFLKEMKLIQSTDSNEEKLSHYAHNVEVHFASRKRNEILARSRSLLLQFDYDLLAVSDVGPNSSAYITDLLFQSDKCIVSKAVLDLMELVHGALKDACLSPARVAKEFYHAARDALLLYKAVIPIKLGKQLDSISQVAIVIYNECQYLSEEVLGLAYEYRTDFPSALQKQALFLDIALNFRQIAENILQKQVHLVSVSLREAIDGADGFQNTHQPQHYESAKFSIEQIVFIVEKARIMWERLLPASTYKRTMCTILDSVFSEIARDLLLLDDLAAEETLQLQRLIQITIENLSSLLESLIIDSVEKQNFLNEATWTHLDEKIPSLPKFRKLADLYDMPLKSITLVWESGELLSCGFTSCEIENFVKAIFADSPLRKECLQRIRNASD
ncbi:centromere/kinetochore protein zw10 homolog [Zingiber officinale]|uniref:centromere/kinetochore protein zw10 homolog n=1 Tax=Zingiber officinale TaxID=94328 RepID=UPI001C4A925C|nr:centromere/kinetochore protein zw10 homolog [Zingiber officinale]